MVNVISASDILGLLEAFIAGRGGVRDRGLAVDELSLEILTSQRGTLGLLGLDRNGRLS